MNRLSCTNLTKRYGRLTALNGITLELQPGKIIGLLGPNGSGKTTFIKLFNGLLQPTAGELLIDGMPIGPDTKAEVAYLPDNDFLPEYMTIKGFLDYYEDFFKDFDRKRAEKLLEPLGLPLNQKIKTCSKGTKEKIRLIVTLSRRAKVYFLDEPIAGVDPAAREYILKTLVENYAEDAIVILSTHLISDVEPILDDVLFIKNGNIVLHEETDSIRERTGKSVDELFREEFRC